mmetsp:Transcript_21138/g.45827  ORF Transcript_21138/g.45827 Transcript_21138/m.45827 type:complete len:223 (+) Transcript_21138:782-1450(+)
MSTRGTLLALAPGCVGMGLEMKLLSSDRTTKAEITDLHRTVLIDEAICRFQVTVIDACRMDVLQADQQIVKQGVDVQRRQGHILFAELLEIGVGQLHHNVEFREGVHVHGGYDFQDLDDIVVLELVQNGDLSQDSLAVDQVLKDAFAPLDGNHRLGFGIFCFANGSVGSRTDEFAHLVSRRNRPILARMLWDRWHPRHLCCQPERVSQLRGHTRRKSQRGQS